MIDEILDSKTLEGVNIVDSFVVGLKLLDEKVNISSYTENKDVQIHNVMISKDTIHEIKVSFHSMHGEFKYTDISTKLYYISSDLDFINEEIIKLKNEMNVIGVNNFFNNNNSGALVRKINVIIYNHDKLYDIIVMINDFLNKLKIRNQ